jgi:hypothetical protein
MIYRLMFASIFVGIGLCVYASHEYTLSAGSAGEPVDVELLDIENGRIPKSPYIRLGPHYRFYADILYDYEIEDENEEPTEHTKVKAAYYPIFSTDGPVGRQMEALIRKYGGYDGIPDQLPDDEWLPDDSPAVIVETAEYKTVGELPQGAVRLENTEGMIVHWGGPMGDELMASIRERFPDINLNKVVILELGRKPTSSIAVFGMIVGGILLSIVPPVVMIRRDRAKLRKLRTKGMPDTQEPVIVDVLEQPEPGPTNDVDNPYRRTY